MERRFDAFVGWRTWTALPHGDEWRLWSATRSTVWPACRPLVATCDRCGDPPGADCDCGVHSRREPGRLRPDLTTGDGTLGWNLLVPVLGRVVHFGRILESDDGWRSERAYPAHLYVVGAPGREDLVEDVVRSLASYLVPVDVLESQDRERAGVRV